MSIDVFDREIRDTIAEAARNPARDMPAGFADSFDVALRENSEWANSVAYNNALERALASYYDDVKARTGEQLPLYGLGGGVTLDDLNAGIARIADKDPDGGFLPLTDADIATMTRRRMAKAHGDAAAMADRETTWGGTLGGFLGATAGLLADPVNVITLPLGGAGTLGVGMRALEFAAIGGGTAAATAAFSAPSREAAVPGSSKEIPGEIAGAAIFGGALGGAFGLLGKWLGKSREPLPTSIRDDVNAGASDAQLNATNVFPGVAAEAAHRDAVSAAVASAVKGEPVKAGDTFFEAWHGSPHEFDRFDIGRVGAGEGQQSYGHGIYIAESKGVADYYRGSVVKYYEPDGAIAALTPDQEEVAGILARNSGDVAAARRDIGRTYDRVDVKAALADLDAVKHLTPSSGNLYQLRINAPRDRLLDLDVALGEQTPYVRSRLEKMLGPDWPEFQSKTGRDLVGSEDMAQAAETSRLLSEAGIPGSKYLDSGSRDSASAQTRNVVMFDDRAIEIVARNGKAIDDGADHFEAWHGSAKQFDQFSLGKVGSGEGAQVEGYGLYFAEKPEVATSYQWALAKGSATQEAKRIADAYGGLDKAIDLVTSRGGADTPLGMQLLEWQRSGGVPEMVAPGHLYQVRIKARKDRMLDWDKPLAEQPTFVGSAIEKNANPLVAEAAQDAVSGKDFYRRLAKGIDGGAQAASRALGESGIVGVRYLDQLSRSVGEGTRNFVVFDDKAIEIVTRNGEVITPARAAAIDAEAKLRPLTIDEIADYEPFDRLPREGEDTAAYWDDVVARATPGELMYLGATDDARVAGIIARDLTPEQIVKLSDEPATYDAVQRNLDRIRLERPDYEFTQAIRLPDGSTQMVTRPLEDVLDEIDGFELAGKELQACATGMMPAE